VDGRAVSSDVMRGGLVGCAAHWPTKQLIKMLQTGKKRGKRENSGTKFCNEIMSKSNRTQKSLPFVHSNLQVLLPKQL
jgi:hypothetical protein